MLLKVDPLEVGSPSIILSSSIGLIGVVQRLPFLSIHFHSAVELVS